MTIAKRRRLIASRRIVVPIIALPADLHCVARIAVAAAGGPAIDGIGTLTPEGLVRLMRRHRMGATALELLEPLCRSRDPETAAGLAAAARAKRIKALRLSEQIATFSRTLSAADIRHLVLKGPALAQSLYGDVAARDSKDIDFLVDPDRFEQAVRLAEQLGYHAGQAFNSPDTKDIALHGRGVEIELHTRLTDISALLPIDFASLWATHRTVDLGGVPVPVLAAPHLMLYLCVHGAEHMWFRLRWLQDIARFVIAMPAETIAECLALAEQLRLTPAVSAALHLVERIFGLPLSQPVPVDATTVRLILLAEEALVLPAHIASNPPVHWLLRKLPVQFNLRRDWRYRRAFVHHLLFSRRSFDLPPWPRWARWAYHPLRPALLLRSRRR